MNYFNEEYSIGKKVLYSFLGMIFLLSLLFQIHLFKVLNEVVSGFTKVIYLFVICIVFIVLLLTVFHFFVILIAVFRLLFDLLLSFFEYVRNIKIHYRHFINTLALIWNNRNKFPYSIFGGFYFYLRLRTKVLGFLFLFAFCFLIFVKCYDYNKNYHRTYWKVEFFPGQDNGRYTFLPNKYYTIHADDRVSDVIINKILYEIDYRNPLPRTWNIIYSDTATFCLGLYYDPVKNAYSAQSFEIWEDKKDGPTLDTNYFMTLLPLKTNFSKYLKK